MSQITAQDDEDYSPHAHRPTKRQASRAHPLSDFGRTATGEYKGLGFRAHPQCAVILVCASSTPNAL